MFKIIYHFIIIKYFTVNNIKKPFYHILFKVSLSNINMFHSFTNANYMNAEITKNII